MDNNEKILDILLQLKNDITDVKTQQLKAEQRLEGIENDMSLLRAERNENQFVNARAQIDLSTIKDDVKIIKQDTKDVKRQVNVLYEWVDKLDIKVKNIDDRIVG